MTPTQWLAEHGWTADEVDLCWLDCERPGHLKVMAAREVILCMQHARVLEAGKFGESYFGAPLPPDSAATEWPWRPIPRVVSVV